MRNVFVFICILLCVSSCHAEDYKEDEDNTIGDISIWNYPVTRTKNTFYKFSSKVSQVNKYQLACL